VYICLGACILSFWQGVLIGVLLSYGKITDVGDLSAEVRAGGLCFLVYIYMHVMSCQVGCEESCLYLSIYTYIYIPTQLSSL
jgi:hypothetical protein